MTRDEFLHQFHVLQGRLASSGVRAEGEIHRPEVDEDTAIESLGVAMEELRVANEELQRQSLSILEARRALEEERARYRDLFEYAADGYLITDLFGTVREANRAAAALLNIRKDFLLGKPLVVFLPEEDRPGLRAVLERLRRTPGLERLEARFLRRRSGSLDADVTILAVLDPGGELTLHWAIRDITERKRADADLRSLTEELERRVGRRTAELEAEFLARERLLIQAHAISLSGPGPAGAPELALINDVDAILWSGDAGTGRYTFVSRGAETILGFPPARWIDEPGFWEGRLHPEDRELAVGQRTRSLRRGLDYDAEYRLLAADNRPIWFRESVRVIEDAAGKPAELRGILVNISKRKRVERQFYAERRDLSAKLEDMAYLHELSGHLAATRDLHGLLDETLLGAMAVQGAVKGIVRLIDRERGELVISGSHGLPEAFVASRDRVPLGAGACGRAVAGVSHVFVEDTEAEGGDEHDREAGRAGGFRAIFSAPILDRCGEVAGTIATYFDEPHRPRPRQVRLVELFVRLAADMIQNASLHQEIRDAGRRREQFLAILAHELRNPLGAIRNATHVLKLCPGDAESVALIDRQLGQLSRLVDDMLDASRIAQGKLQLRLERVDLGALAASVAEEVGPAAQARRQELLVNLPGHPLWVEADPGRMRQVLLNLLNNAVRYGGPGALIELSASKPDGEAVVRVRDTGIGIAPAALPGLFELFHQVDPQGRSSVGGLGIGLWLVRNLVELHGGRVVAASPGVGQGSEFTVFLPLAEPAADAGGSGTASQGSKNA